MRVRAAREPNNRQLPTDHTTYEAYLKSDHWANRRVSYRVSHPYRCVGCGRIARGKQHLNLHHRSYDHLGDEPDDDLVYLCSPCHRKTHRLAKKIGLWNAHEWIRRSETEMFEELYRLQRVSDGFDEPHPDDYKTLYGLDVPASDDQARLNSLEATTL